MNTIMLTRRELLRRGVYSGTAVALSACGARCALKAHLNADDKKEQDNQGALVNDTQSQLNPTRVCSVVATKSLDEVASAVRSAVKEVRSISVCGGRHSMGGQQFASDAVLLDMREFLGISKLDRDKGLVEVAAGTLWPDLIKLLNARQRRESKQWTIRQKQTGVDKVTIGGSLASNIHGRGLRFPPFVGDIESFVLVDAQGKPRTCSRTENSELFSLAIGGYGLFGIVTQVTLRLVPRTKLKRLVEVIAVKDLLAGYDKRIEGGFVYGDCQYATNLDREAESHPGVFSCYRPVANDTPVPENQKQLSEENWAELYRLARTDKRKAFERYAEYYQSTSGQVYWSDAHQLAGMFDGYRSAVETQRGTEVITEVYVRAEKLVPFLARARQDFIDHNVDMTYGTIRFIQPDKETFLPWAREESVCIVCNLHVRHSAEGKQKAAEDFRRIIDRAIEFDGRYFLTYHRHATRKQVETCYPKFAEFLRLKKKYDPGEVFQSEWYRHYRDIFAGSR